MKTPHSFGILFVSRFPFYTSLLVLSIKSVFLSENTKPYNLFYISMKTNIIKNGLLLAHYLLFIYEILNSRTACSCYSICNHFIQYCQLSLCETYSNTTVFIFNHYIHRNTFID